MSNSVKDIVSGSALLALSIAVYVTSLEIRQILPFGVCSGFFPRIVAVLLAFVSVIIIVQGLRTRATEKGEKSTRGEDGALWVVFATLLLIGFYVAFLEFLGFIVTTFVYLVGQFAVLAPRERRNWIAFIGISAVVSFCTYYVFYHFFHLILPTGIFG